MYSQAKQRHAGFWVCSEHGHQVHTVHYNRAVSRPMHPLLAQADAGHVMPCENQVLNVLLLLLLPAACRYCTVT